jgi:hypothetical protein
LEGYPFKITPNLENAMYELRSDHVQIFWIDALCINQKNDSERSKQVGKMRTIYNRAEKVVIWLGSSTPSVSRAFSLFEAVYENRSSKTAVADMLRDIRNHKGLEAIIELYRRSYWERIWVVQEVISAREATVMCGEYKIDWFKLQKIQNQLWKDHSRYILELSSHEPMLSDLSLQIGRQGIKAMELPGNAYSGVLDISTLLSTFWVKRASDPRDMIYALVGLSSARNDSRFVVDYSASVCWVFTSVLKYILLTTKKLDVICSMIRASNDFDLPTWVPDWASPTEKYALPVLSIVETEGVQYCSAGTSAGEYQLMGNDRILKAKGILLSRIHFVGLKGTMDSATDFRASLPILLNWYKLLNVIKPPGPAEVEAFCRTILYDRIPPPKKSNKERHPMVFMEKLLGAIALLTDKYCPEEKVDPNMVRLKEKHSSKQWWAERWLEGACEIAIQRRFFVTNTDRIGISPDTSETGDLICVLLGCWMPVVLRPKDGHYVLLGEAYVHGYMYGEAMAELAEGKFQLQDFEIH